MRNFGINYEKLDISYESRCKIMNKKIYTIIKFFTTLNAISKDDSN